MAILDGYTVEPSGLGVPPYLSTYVRDAYSALRKAYPSADVRYLTIDDVRWCLNGGAPSIAPPQSDPRTYSATVNRDRVIQILRDATVVVVVAGDKVPSVHLHAENATTDELVLERDTSPFVPLPPLHGRARAPYRPAAAAVR